MSPHYLLFIFSTFFFFFILFFFNDTATTEIYTLSLHDALPIFHSPNSYSSHFQIRIPHESTLFSDRKSTRLNSSHGYISYAVFCLKKKKKKNNIKTTIYKKTNN